MRGFDSATSAILSSHTFITTELVELHLDTPLYLSTAGYDVMTDTPSSSGTQTYIAQGDFIAFSGVRETDQVKINNVSISLQGATATYRNIVLNDNYLHRSIKIYKVLLDQDTLAPEVAPILIYDGQITGASVKESPQEAIVTLATSNEFYDFERVAGRRTNNGSQQRHYPSDMGMEFSTSAIADIQWGKP
mgnify:CR=1 FL=1